MDPASYDQLLLQAMAICSRSAEAHDLLHDALLAGVQASRFEPAWLAGVMRNLHVMRLRTEGRRRRRDLLVGSELKASTAHSPPDARAPSHAWLSNWPRAPRQVAVLALHGLDAEEIRWILDLRPAAFRQRLSDIRKRLDALTVAARADADAAAQGEPARIADLPLGRIRRALKVALQGGDGLATHDEDGHLLVIRGRPHTSPSRGN